MSDPTRSIAKRTHTHEGAKRRPQIFYGVKKENRNEEMDVMDVVDDMDTGYNCDMRGMFATDD